jgi:hypothetical protein
MRLKTEEVPKATDKAAMDTRFLESINRTVPELCITIPTRIQ